MKQEYYSNKASVNEYLELAKDVNSGQLIKKLENVLKQNSSLLELGSGPGTDWRLLSKSYNVVGSDNSDEFLTHLQVNNPNGKFIDLDAVSLETELLFDGIYSNKVLHHLTNDELAKSIQRQSEILNPNGIICHSFWKGEGNETFKGMFVNYHNEKSLISVFENCFEVISIKVYQEFEEDDSLVLIGRNK